VITVIVGLGATAVLSFWGWLAIKTIDQGRKLIELEVKITNHEKRDDEHLEWFLKMDAKITEVMVNTAACRAQFGGCNDTTQKRRVTDNKNDETKKEDK